MEFSSSIMEDEMEKRWKSKLTWRSVRRAFIVWQETSNDTSEVPLHLQQMAYELGRFNGFRQVSENLHIDMTRLYSKLEINLLSKKGSCTAGGKKRQRKPIEKFSDSVVVTRMPSTSLSPSLTSGIGLGAAKVEIVTAGGHRIQFFELSSAALELAHSVLAREAV